MSRQWWPLWAVCSVILAGLFAATFELSNRWSRATTALNASEIARSISREVASFQRSLQVSNSDSFAASYIDKKRESVRRNIDRQLEQLDRLTLDLPQRSQSRLAPFLAEFKTHLRNSGDFGKAGEQIESIVHVSATESSVLHMSCRQLQNQLALGLMAAFIVVAFVIGKVFRNSERRMIKGFLAIEQSDKLSARRHQLQIQATRILSTTQCPREAVEALTLAIAESEEFDLAHVLYVDEATQEAKSCGAWSGAHSHEFAGFRRTVDSCKVVPGEGAPGRAMLGTKAVWIENIESEDTSSRLRTSPEHPVSSCVAVPISAHGHVVAILEFFLCERRPADPNLMAALESLTVHFGMLYEFSLQRVQTEHQAAELDAQRIQLGELAESLDEKEAHLRALTSQVTVREKQLSIAEEELEDARAYAGRTKGLFEVAARRFEELFNGIPVACFTTDLNGVVYEWNRAAEELWRHPAYATLQKNVFDLLCDSHNDEAMKEMLAIVAEGEAVPHREIEMATSEGKSIHLVAAVFPLTTVDGTMTGAVWSMTEITERKQVEDQIRTSEARLRALLEAMQSGVLLLSAEGVVELTNPRMAEMLGYDSKSECLLGQALHMPAINESGRAIHPRNSPILRAAKRGESVHDHTMGIRHPNGNLIWLHTNAAPVLDANGSPNGAVASFVDITKQREDEQRIRESMQKIRDYSEEMERQSAELAVANHQLEQLATLDGLTGLKNHRSFQEFFEQQFQGSKRHGTQLSLILLDVDQFKKFNDQFGHPAGDDVLREVAQQLKSVARTSDFVARYGGEEFVVVLPNTSANEAIEAAERMRTAIAESRWALRPITISLGVATYKKKMADRSELIAEADAAMYSSKQNGRNRTTHIRDLRRDAA